MDVPPEIVGNLFAVAAASMWAINSLLFAKAGQRIGAISLNAIRIAMAVAFLLIAHLILFQTVMPDATLLQMLILLLSGVIGLALGDFFYFSGLVILGARRGSLVMGTWPIFAAIIAFPVLGERIGVFAVFGIFLTMFGVTWVVMERAKKKEGKETDAQKKADKKKLIMGVGIGILGALGQAGGYVIAKWGMTLGGNEMHTLSATFVRMVGGFVVVWIIILGAGYGKKVFLGFKDNKATLQALGGAFFGPFLGVWFSLIAAMYTYIGIGATLMALTPIIMIPLVMIIDREKVSPRAIVGTLVAFGGVSILFLEPYIMRFLF